MTHKTFTKDDGTVLPFDDGKYLLPFMTPTSASTQLRDGPPEGPIAKRQQGRILLQIHQLLYLTQLYGIDLEGRTMLDVGTGNGMIPCLALELSGLRSAVGSDPYLDGELAVSWQVHDHEDAFKDLVRFIKKHCPDGLDYNAYKHLLEYENYALRPGPVKVRLQPSKPYRFAKVGAHDLNELDEQFDFVYAKAVEHISDWDGMFASIAEAVRPDAVVYFKHRTFFSYLGAHRRGSVGIPWGHLLLTDAEYRRCVDEFYPDDAARMKEFYFEGLTYPRQSVSEMIVHAQRHGFCLLAVISEPARYIDQTMTFINDVDNFWRIVASNHPCYDASEVMAGMVHILFRKHKA